MKLKPLRKRLTKRQWERRLFRIGARKKADCPHCGTIYNVRHQDTRCGHCIICGTKLQRTSYGGIVKKKISGGDFGTCSDIACLYLRQRLPCPEIGVLHHEETKQAKATTSKPASQESCQDSNSGSPLSDPRRGLGSYKRRNLPEIVNMSRL